MVVIWTAAVAWGRLPFGLAKAVGRTRITGGCTHRHRHTLTLNCSIQNTLSYSYVT